MAGDELQSPAIHGVVWEPPAAWNLTGSVLRPGTADTCAKDVTGEEIEGFTWG